MIAARRVVEQTHDDMQRAELYEAEMRRRALAIAHAGNAEHAARLIEIAEIAEAERATPAPAAQRLN